MTVLQICAIAVTGVCTAMILKQWKSDLLPLFRMAIAILIGVAVLTSASPLLTFLKNISANTPLAPYTPILLKALGVALLTQYCSEICKECGEGGVATGVEAFGKIQILLLCLPLLSELFLLAQKLLGSGGSP